MRLNSWFYHKMLIFISSLTYYPPSKGTSRMTPKKIVILSILISLTSHALIIYLTGLADWPGKVRMGDVLTITLKEPTKRTEKNTEEKKEIKPTHQADENANVHKMKEEETVDINTLDVKYTPYLKKIKRKIEDIWTYPQAAFAQEEEGTAVVKFSISDRGVLLASGIVSSSGSNYLDQGALDVVRSAAPYDPFPREFHLLQLNVVARFQYRLVD
jgi:TonB family protein